MASNRKRRGRGEGSVFYRADRKCWAASATVEITATGKQKRVTAYAKGKAEALKKLEELKTQVSAGLTTETRDITIAAFLQQWLEVAVKPNLRPNTYVGYESVVRNHLVPRIGRLKLSKLTKRHVAHLYVELEKAGVSPRMRQLSHAILRSALQQAVEWEYVPRNVVAANRRPKAPKKQFMVLKQTEARRFIEAAREDRFFALYVLAIATGLRQGELLGLRWEDIDLKEGKLSVRRTLTEVKGHLTVGEPKTKRATRQIHLPPVALAALKSHRQAMLAEGHINGFVFCDSAGGPMRKSNLVRRSFKPILTKAELPNIRFHDLRHTAATLLLSAGEHPKVVQEILGHSTIAITMDTYSHVWPTMQQAAAEKMNKLLAEGE